VHRIQLPMACWTKDEGRKDGGPSHHSGIGAGEQNSTTSGSTNGRNGQFSFNRGTEERGKAKYSFCGTKIGERQKEREGIMTQQKKGEKGGSNNFANGCDRKEGTKHKLGELVSQFWMNRKKNEGKKKATYAGDKKVFWGW